MDYKSPVASSPSSSSAACVEEALPCFSHEEQTALQWALGEREREPTKVSCVAVVACCQLLFWLVMICALLLFLQLRLWVERLDVREVETTQNLNAEHVRLLWRMDRDKRVQVWRELGRFQEVTKVELGGELGCLCPMDVEELLMLLPEGAGALSGLRTLFLRWYVNQVDSGLHALSSAGCGENLTSLTLWSECHLTLVRGWLA